MYPKYNLPTELLDCKEHAPGSGAELFIVEGDSAAKSVSRLRNVQTQAVIPMQGKPLNAYKAKREKVLANDLYQAVLTAMGCINFVIPNQLRYDRVILLFDPDADGIHCSALMTLFFYRWLKPILENGQLFLVRAPLYEIATQDREKVLLAHSDEQYRQMCEKLDKPENYKRQRYRGLGSMNDDVLYRSCLNHDTRYLYRLTLQDAEASLAIFGGTYKGNID